MNEQRRLTVAVAIPALLLAAMMFAPLEAVARPTGAAPAGPLSIFFPQATDPADGAPRRSTPLPAANESYDWADVLRVNGITYSAGLLNSGRALREEDVGREVARVTARLNGVVKPVGYEIKDGDAAYLDAGTAVYAMAGYEPRFRLVAHRLGRVVLFEAVANPNARTGRDLLDIDGRVASIAIDVNDPRSVGRSIDRPAEVSAVVSAVLSTKLQPSAPFGKRTSYVSFRLLDGTAVTLQFSAETGSLSRGLAGLSKDIAGLLANAP